jgi:outer membrane protein TolC
MVAAFATLMTAAIAADIASAEEPIPLPAPLSGNAALDGFRWQSSPVPNDDGYPEAYQLGMLLDWAANNNPTLRQARFQVSATLAQAQQAGLYPNPALSYVADNIGTGGTPGEFQGAEVRQRFVTAHKLDLSRNKYLQRAQVAEHLAVAQQFKVCNDVKLHFFATLAAQELLGLRRELLKTAEDRLVTTKELFNLGQANQVDLHRATAELRRQQLEVLSAENRVRQQFLQLAARTGVELPVRPVNGALASERQWIEFETAQEYVLGGSPELLAAYAKLRGDGITVQRESVQWVPDIVVSTGSGYNFDSRDPVANARVMLDVPIFDRNQGTIRQAQADRGRQQQEVRRIELLLTNRLAEQYNNYITALQRVTSYEDSVLPEMRAAYEQALKSYRANREEWPTVLDTHSEYTMRRIEQVQNLQQLRAAEILIDGYLLHDGLEAAPNPTPPGHIDAVPKPR